MKNKIGGVKIKNSVGTFAVIVVIGLTMASLSAYAQTEIFNGTIDASTLGSTATTTLPEFDSSLGTLTGVQVTLDFQVTPYAEVFNVTGGPNTFSPSDYAYTPYPSNPNVPWTISLGTDMWS